MNIIYLLIAFLLFTVNGCSDFSSNTNEFELSGKMYVCDENVFGDIANDISFGKKWYCNGTQWINLISEDSIPSNTSTSQFLYECKNGTVVKFKEFCNNTNSKYIPLDDTKYPYAGIPRIVIETENHQEIKNRETKIPAKLQIWGESAPESEIMSLTIKGRGNSSWGQMPKKSYKLEFSKKQSPFSFPQNKDWALIANFADKTLLKNFFTYNLYSQISADFTPKCKFVEIFINQEYLGVYLFTETIKVAQNRVNIPTNEDSFLAEFSAHYKVDDQVIFLLDEHPIIIKSPKNISLSNQRILNSHLDFLSNYIRNNQIVLSNLSKWLDFYTYLEYYWIQEFSKNIDGGFYASTYFTWIKDGPIKMGPIWDFDLGYHGHPYEETMSPTGWLTRDVYWNKTLFQNTEFVALAANSWNHNKKLYRNAIDSIKVYSSQLALAANNNFKRWNVLESTENIYHIESFHSYQDAIASFVSWVNDRYEWIDSQVNQ